MKPSRVYPGPALTDSVDPVGLKLLHMVTADPARTPTFVAFAKPDYFVDTFPAACPGGACA